MKRVSVTLDLPEAWTHPMHAAMDDGVARRAWALEANVTPDEQSFLFRVEGDHDAYVERLDALDGVREYDTTPAGESSFYLVVREARGALHEPMFDAFRRGDVVRHDPIVFTPGRRAELSLVGAGGAVEAALDELPEDVGIAVDSVREGAAGADLAADRLTDRQREALAAARRVGYFAVPREGSVADVADELGCSSGTASEHLRKAQAALTDAVLE